MNKKRMNFNSKNINLDLMKPKRTRKRRTQLRKLLNSNLRNTYSYFYLGVVIYLKVQPSGRNMIIIIKRSFI